MFYYKPAALSNEQIDKILNLPVDYEEINPPEDLELTRRLSNRKHHQTVPAWLQNILNEHAELANQNFKLRIFPNSFGHFSNLTYVEGGFTDWHNDAHFKEMFSNPSRKITIIITTNDPGEYAGGCLEINSKSYRLEAMEDEPLPDGGRFPKGSIFIFPSTLFHRVTTVTSGTRKSFVAYMSGPAWR